MADAQVEQVAKGMTPALRHWLWVNLGIDIYDWEDDDIRF